MPDALNLHDPGIAEDFVNHPIISDADAIRALGTGELMRTVRQRVFRQFAHGLDDAGHLLTRQTADVLPRGVAPLDAQGFHRAGGQRGIRRAG